MSESSATKGPWKLQHLTDDYHGLEGWSVYAIRSARSNVCLASVGTVDRYQSERIESNARLMTAAPDLLAACERALPWLGKLIADGAHLNSVAPNDAVGAMDQMQAAIDRAKRATA